MASGRCPLPFVGVGFLKPCCFKKDCLEPQTNNMLPSDLTTVFKDNTPLKRLFLVENPKLQILSTAKR